VLFIANASTEVNKRDRMTSQRCCGGIRGRWRHRPFCCKHFSCSV